MASDYLPFVRRGLQWRQTLVKGVLGPCSRGIFFLLLSLLRPLPVGSLMPLEQPLRGQLVLVTGGAQRVGRAICLQLAQAGAQVAIHYHRSQDAAHALAKELGQGAFAVAADLRELAQTREMFAQVTQGSQSGRVDALVNNAALFARTPLLPPTSQSPLDEAWQQQFQEQWEEQLRVNLTAPQRCIQLAVAGGATAVVNVVDIAAWQPWAEFSAYSVAKAGLLQLTRVLARELAPRVRVSAVAPGMVLLPAESVPGASAWTEKVQARVPLGRIGEPSDVARAVCMLLTEPFLTGVCLPVDGGQGLR